MVIGIPPVRLQENAKNLHPSLKSRRVRAFLLRTRAAVRRTDAPFGGSRRPAERAELERHDLDLLDLLTLALDTAEDHDLQILISYARTSLILSLTR